MKIRIVKKYTLDGEYYIVQRQNFFKFWVPIRHPSVSKTMTIFDDYWVSRKFYFLEDANSGLYKLKQHLKKVRNIKKDEVVHVETI